MSHNTPHKTKSIPFKFHTNVAETEGISLFLMSRMCPEAIFKIDHVRGNMCD